MGRYPFEYVLKDTDKVLSQGNLDEILVRFDAPIPIGNLTNALIRTRDNVTHGNLYVSLIYSGIVFETVDDFEVDLVEGKGLDIALFGNQLIEGQGQVSGSVDPVKQIQKGQKVFIASHYLINPREERAVLKFEEGKRYELTLRPEAQYRS